MEWHVPTLQKFFTRLRKYNICLNSQKCSFGVTSRKLLGYVVSLWWIKLNPSNVKAIQEMSLPKIEKEIWGFLGYLQYINRFISKWTMVYEPIFKKLKKEVNPIWDMESKKRSIKLRSTFPIYWCWYLHNYHSGHSLFDNNDRDNRGDANLEDRLEGKGHLLCE